MCSVLWGYFKLLEMRPSRSVIQGMKRREWMNDIIIGDELFFVWLVVFPRDCFPIEFTMF